MKSPTRRAQERGGRAATPAGSAVRAGLLASTSGSRPAAFKGARVLVTGGAGFLGSRISASLLELGARVVVLDDLTTGRRELIPKGIHRFVHNSVTDAHELRRWVRWSDYVFHLAARVLASSTRDIMADYSVNIGGMLNVLTIAREMGREAPRIVYTSTSSVYGNPRSLPITEDDPVNILSPYAASKHAAESYCSAFFEMHSLPLSWVRYSNVYGPHQSPLNPYCGVISKFIEASLEGRAMTIHGSGMQTRDFTYVDDAVAATLLAAVTPRALGEVINVGSGMETSVRELCRLVARATGREESVTFVDRRDIDNVQRRVLNIEKARRILGWIPNIPLEVGLLETVKWILSLPARRDAS